MIFDVWVVKPYASFVHVFEYYYDGVTFVFFIHIVVLCAFVDNKL